MPDKKKRNQITSSTQVAPVPVKTQHTEEFTSLYANSIRFEPTVYDLKLVFGETDQTSGTEIIQQHTAITIPWALVKVFAYFLRVNFEIHEMMNGKVLIPPSQLPQPIPSLPPEQAQDPHAQQARDLAIRLREEFIANL
jgi:hypothetical protein